MWQLKQPIVKGVGLTRRRKAEAQRPQVERLQEWKLQQRSAWQPRSSLLLLGSCCWWQLQSEQQAQLKQPVAVQSQRRSAS